MINKMRVMAPIIMLVILIAFLGTIFLDWGMNLTRRGRQMMPAGKINGKEISLSYFDKQVNLARQRMQDGDKEVPPQQYRMIPQQVWEQEVNKQLVKEVVEKLHLGASADEVFNYIKKNPLPGIDTVSAFQTDNKFDTSKYEQFLNDPMNYQQYRWLNEIENYTTNNIVPSQKLEQLLSAAAMPTPAEINYNYLKKNNKVVFEFVKSGPVDLDSSAVSDEMLVRYYETNRDSFELEDNADIYYIKFAKEATEADEKFYREELLELRKRIENDDQPLAEAFAKEAEYMSDDEGTAKKGGDLDWFERGRMVGPFDSAAFTQEVGTISEPVKTSFGLHLIYVEAREERDSVLKVRARHILRKITPTIETLDLLAEKADSLRVVMLDEGFVTAANKEKGVVFDSTGLFEKGGPIPGIGYLSGTGAFISGKSDQPISERLENKDGFYLLAVKRIIKKGLMPLEDARKKILSTLIDSMSIAAGKARLDSLRSLVPDTASLAAISEIDSTFISGVTDTVGGGEYVAQIGYSSPVVAHAFSHPVGEITGVVEYDDNLFITKTLWKKPVDSVPSLGSPDMQRIAQMLRQQTAQKIYYEWYLSYKNSQNVVSNIDKIYLD
jgi:hypothetical protein